MSTYKGRFAPSPTGRLHRGSLAAALASWLDARAHGGVWVVRIEDIDPPRDVPGAAEDILRVLTRLGMTSDEPVRYQSRMDGLYEAALEKLRTAGRLYGCACSRTEIRECALALSLAPNVYPGTCRRGTNGRPVRMLRFLTDDQPVTFTDRWCGPFTQNVERECGDFVVKRADGLWAYQLAVVADDIDQGVTDIVRGADLLDNTPRQIMLTKALGGVPARYMHVPLVLNDRGEKLSKQQGAVPLTDDLMDELERAFTHLGFPRIGADTPEAFLKAAVPLWAERFRD
ncbi:MAG: tRNA glutamyl-Q(34) synthetase GluQRS [Sutterella parvirubra]|nr:tRNA glutamyl-Q(34) synthetase GluQRS [Sutterella parvirubra]MDY5201495.1 tRNA glutamyl-Q(34) synthetase GluQRS [Sutterella parvirubra]